MTIELFNDIVWFYSIYEDEIQKEGWNFFAKGYNINERVIFVKPLNDKKSLTMILKIVKEYGFEFDKNGLIIGFNKDNINRNKHLLTASDLGLL